jgi:hypothetical protein
VTRIERIERLMVEHLLHGTLQPLTLGDDYDLSDLQWAYNASKDIVEYVEQRQVAEYAESQQARDVAAMLAARDSAPLPMLNTSTPASWDGEPGPV